MTSGPLRIVRAGTATLVALALGLAGHTLLVGPDLGSPLLLGAAAVTLAAFAWLLAGRERRLPAIVAVLALGQAVTHLALVGSSLATAGGAEPGVVGHVAYCVLKPSALAGTGGGAGSVALMIAVHLAATLACAWWLRRGELALVRRLRVVVRAVGAAFRLAPPVDRLSSLLVRPAAPSAVVTSLRALAGPGRGWSRRGPPAALPVRA